jgi:hypothetical protein
LIYIYIKILIKVKVKRLLYRQITEPEVSRKVRLPDLETKGT